MSCTPSRSINGLEKSSWLLRRAIHSCGRRSSLSFPIACRRNGWMQLEQALQSKELTDEIARLLPADTFYLAVEFRQRYPQETASWGTAGQALDKLSREYPAEVSLERISKDFGIPHPAMAQTYGRELLNVKPFPAFSGNSSRLFGESWDSSNLYWARLADERSDSPVTLNVLSPQLTRLMVSKIFATDFEDWPAIVRAMHEAGDEFLAGQGRLAGRNKVGCQR